MLQQKVKHWPTLNTVIMVEDVLKNMPSSAMTIPELKKSLPRQVNHNTLMLILEYLEHNGMIVVGLRGVTWSYNTSPKLKKAIAEGMRL